MACAQSERPEADFEGGLLAGGSDGGGVAGIGDEAGEGEVEAKL